MLRENIVNLCKENETLLLSITDNPQISQLIKEMTKPIQLRIENILKICSTSAYTLCFIGEVGVGKSTAIAGLLGLTADMNAVEGQKLQDVSLIPTASGRTTACETTIVLNNDHCKIEMEKMGTDEFEKLISQYADFILEPKSEENGKFPTEVSRIINNMSGFPEDEKDWESYIADGNTADGQDPKARLMSALLSRINYEGRNNSVLTCETDQDKDWLKETLSAINKGTLAGMPYPSNITIYVRRGSAGAEIPKFITRIKDTRGIDGKGARDDIAAYCKDSGSICVLCDSVTAYGNIISDTFLREQFVDSNIDIKYRNVLLGLEKRSELEEVNDAQGRENGKCRKVKEVKGAFQSIYFEEKNMLFYDAFRGFSYDNKNKITGLDEEEYALERRAFFHELEAALERMYRGYAEELGALHDTLDTFMRNEVDEAQKRKLSRFSDIIKECKNEYAEKHEDVVKDLDDSMRSTHASKLRAAINRKGEYNNYSLYSEIAHCTLKHFGYSVEGHKDYLQKQVKEIFDSGHPLENAVITIIEYNIKQELSKYREKDSADFRKAVYHALINSPIWDSAEMPVWGDRKGDYRGRAARPIMSEIDRRKAVQKVIDEQNIPKFYDSLLQWIMV